MQFGWEIYLRKLMSHDYEFCTHLSQVLWIKGYSFWTSRRCGKVKIY